jgi:hypothetical protein
MRFLTLSFAVFSLLIAGCIGTGSEGTAEVEVEIVNRSPVDLGNAYAMFGEHKCSWGWVVSGSSKSYMAFPHPIGSGAELTWEIHGVQRAVRLDLKDEYVPGASGRLTFIVSSETVDVSFRRLNQ